MTAYKWRDSINIWAEMGSGGCSCYEMIFSNCIIDKIETNEGTSNEALQDCVQDFLCFRHFIDNFRATS